MRLPLSEELRTSQLLESCGLTDRARVHHLGESRTGRPIDLISVGHGAHSALIVGAPHPNEPTGCLTIVRMLSRLGAAGQLPDAPDWQWHFIPAIDIDGITLNESWFREPLTLQRYLAGFYRPPFREQPEYSFPLDLPGYRFDAETPESLCWRSALEAVRPDLQCALHGADTGGSFFITSEEAPILAERLARLPARFGITLNDIGEPFAEMTPHRPGVFSFPAVAGLPSWNAGDSSAGYARRRFGTVSMTCEVPLWCDAREHSTETSDRTPAQVVDDWIDQLEQDENLLGETLPALSAGTASFEAQALTAALVDALHRAPGTVAALEEARSAWTGAPHLPTCDLARLGPGTAGLRTPAMLSRLAGLSGNADVRHAAERVLTTRLDTFTRTARPTPIRLESATDLQIAAILETANASRLIIS